MLTKDEIRDRLLTSLSTMIGDEVALKDTDNLLRLGLESLPTMRLLAEWIKQGYHVSFGSFMRSPTVAQWADMLFEAAPSQPDDDSAVGSADDPDGGTSADGDRRPADAADFEPFDLTDVQYAYWIGRGRAQRLGSVGCHGYVEIEAGAVDVPRLEASWGAVLRAHPMLRACYTRDGQQRVLPEPRDTAVVLHDLSGLDERGQQAELLDLRDSLSHRLLDIESGQVCCLQVSRLNQDRAILHFDIDLLVCDVRSFQIILRDLAHHYLTGQPPEVDPSWSFATYLKRKEHRDVTRREHDKEYWRSRIHELTGGPGLPVRQGTEVAASPRFTRRSHSFDQKSWQGLRALCEGHGTTPAMVLLTAYARTIARWSEDKRFFISIPLFNRDSDPEIENVVADFTTLTLTQVDQSRHRRFVDDLKAIQSSFYEDVSHSAYSAVKVLRDLHTQRGEQVLAPVVFSCNLGSPLVDKEFIEAFGEIGYMISQTPQVWIDLQVFNTIEGFTVIWDAVEQIFPVGLLEEMFDCLVREIERVISAGLEHVDVVESRAVARRRRTLADLPQWQLPDSTLIDRVIEAAARHPEATAISTSDGQVTTYQDLVAHARAIARSLVAAGAGTGDLAAVMLPRGPEQIISALAVMAAGMAYVPISRSQPPQRVAAILASPRLRFLLTDDPVSEQWAQAGVIVISFDQALACDKDVSLPTVGPADPAYVIYTSGTTGTPKGVEMSHGAVWNTIEAVNRRIGLGPQDALLGVSAFDFDLSVYDAFGALSVGGRLVTIPEQAHRDADYWLRAVRDQRITVWNSVPVLFEMLLTSAGQDPLPLSGLRHVLLSGDWIDVSLPARMRTLIPGCRLLAMGGATEAAIWSNAFDVDEVPEQWASIPYGRALDRQAYRVVDSAGRDCPDYVVGELWIGGLGVAKGYVDDPRLTQEKFVVHEGGRWYRTGDLGRFWHDGTLEFLGRSDTQIKLRGHRIELGEIEAACESLLDAKRAVCLLHQGRTTQFLVAFIQPETAPVPDREQSAVMSLEVADVLEPVLTEEKTRQAIARDEEVQGAYARETMRRWMRRLAGRGTALENDVPIRLDLLTRRWTQWLTQDKEKTSAPTAAELAELERFIAPFGEAFINNDAPMSAAELIQSPEFIPVEAFVSDRPLGRLTHRAIRALLERIHRETGDGIRVLELGARRPNDTEEYFLATQPSVYIVADYSRYYLDKMTGLSAGRFETMLLIPSAESPSLMEEPACGQGIDLAICNQTLHQSVDIDETLRQIRNLLKPQGILIIVEPTASSPLADVSAAFLSPSYRDARHDSGDMLLRDEEWVQVLERAGYTQVSRTSLSDSLILMIASRTGAEPAMLLSQKHYEQAVELLSTRLPDYMLPKKIVRVPDIPVTSNGKVDRRALAVLVPLELSEHGQGDRDESATETETRLIEIWNALLGADASTDSDYFRLGGDSLMATRLRRQIEEDFEIEFSLDAVFEFPVLADMAARIEELTTQARPRTELPPIVRSQDQHEPFPLTDVQQSYLIGSSGAIELGDVSSHCYFEMSVPVLDLKRLEESFNALISRHPMLRAVVCDDGLTQRFLPEVPRYPIVQVPSDGAQGDRQIAEVRREMSCQRFDPRCWPCFDVRYTVVADSGARLFLSFDNTFIDGWSMFQVFHEWKGLYQAGAPSTEAEAEAYSFKDYVEATVRLKEGDAYHRDLRYWEDLLSQIHPAPQLPVSPGDASSEFVRQRALIEAPVWEAARQRIRAEGLTEAAFLAEVYAEVLAAYSESPALSINLTQFDRIRFTPEVDSIVGDFTSLSILSVDTQSGSSFSERARALQRRMWNNLAHSHVSGVVVERMLNRQRRSQVTMPVVFTCGLGVVELTQDTDSPYLGDIDYGLSQTPQVWMDLQVYEDDGALVLNLDSVDGILPDGMVTEMFQALTQAVQSLATTSSLCDETLTVCPRFNTQEVVDLNATQVQETVTADTSSTCLTLLGLFRKSCRSNADRPAIIDQSRELSYTELDAESDRWARLIAAHAPASGDVVAILLERSAYQVSAILGVLKAGCAYLPLSTAHPSARNSRIIADAGVHIIVTDHLDYVCEAMEQQCSVISVPDVQENIVHVEDTRDDSHSGERPTRVSDEVFSYDEGCLVDDLAYIIYTSGTTGDPKGVAITNGAVVNTILDVNHRLRVGPDDRILALSQLNFDLSVYDIFGMLACGGTIVMPSPEEALEPSHWWHLVRSHGVTLWNSVPALFSMYTGYLNNEGITDETTRAVLLSGDWIPVDVGLRIAESFKNCRAYGLGGATEVSIWSSWYEIGTSDAELTSIPYGRPLANQKMYVLDSSMEHRPSLVPGDLYIGGRGLAQGYWNDPQRTEDSFVHHPRLGERIYRTGDRAMYGRDGDIVFLGRSDGQVKIGGYRIELGEIESVALALPGIRDCVATATTDGIILYAVVTDQFQEILINKHMAEYLPDYMRPRRVVLRDELPRTWNGKIDRDNLVLEALDQHPAPVPVPPSNDRENRLLMMWARVLDRDDMGVDDDFFRLGGDSLAAVHLANLIKQEMSVGVSIKDVFTFSTVRRLCEHIDESLGSSMDEGEI